MVTSMTWNAIEPAKACDIADFWAAAPWPLTRPQTNQRAAELGWTIEDGDFPVDGVSGLSMTDVDTSVMPDGNLAWLAFYATDVIRDQGRAAQDFIDDNYALVVREGRRRWGEPTMGRLKSGGPSARWDVPDGPRITVLRTEQAVWIRFTTPQYAPVLRKSGE